MSGQSGIANDVQQTFCFRYVRPLLPNGGTSRHVCAWVADGSVSKTAELRVFARLPYCRCAAWWWV